MYVLQWVPKILLSVFDCITHRAALSHTPRVKCQQNSADGNEKNSPLSVNKAYTK